MHRLSSWYSLELLLKLALEIAKKKESDSFSYSRLLDFFYKSIDYFEIIQKTKFFEY